MSGDGLTDIVRVRNGEVCYWPSTGYGRFGAKVTMDGAPRFDAHDLFDPRRVRLADIDGTGTADLLYVGADGVTAWFNQSGNGWSAPTVVAVFPTADELSTRPGDRLARHRDGLPGLVLAAAPPHVRRPAAVRGPDERPQAAPAHPAPATTWARRPGSATRRRPGSTSHDADAGRPWVTRLPFPVQVVERIETIDWIGRSRLVTRYAYHHGYFDAYEREFRGFGMVEQWDTEEFRADTVFDDGDFVNWDQQSWSPPVLTRTWFHTGAFEQAAAVAAATPGSTGPSPRCAAPARRPPPRRCGCRTPCCLTGSTRSRSRRPTGRSRDARCAPRCTAATGPPRRATRTRSPSRTTRSASCSTEDPTCTRYLYACPRETLTFSYERGAADPRVSHELTLETDAYGNVLRAVSVGYPRRAGLPAARAGPAARRPVDARLRPGPAPRAGHRARLHQRRSTTPASWPDAYRVPLPASADSAEITGVTPPARAAGITDLFTFDDIDGPGGVWAAAWQAASDIAYEQVPASDVDGTGTPSAGPARRFVSRERVLYRADDLSALLGPGVLEPRALPGESYQAALTEAMVTAVFGAAGARLDAGQPAATSSQPARPAGGSRRGACTTPPATPPATATPPRPSWRPRSTRASCRCGPSTRSAG